MIRLIQAETAEFELLAEKLLVDAYALRDSPSLENLVSVMASTAQLGQYFSDREKASSWIDYYLLRS